MSFSHFGELWLAGSQGGGITSGISYIEVAVGQSELGSAASRKAVWWDLRLASLLRTCFLVVNCSSVTTFYSSCVRHWQAALQKTTIEDGSTTSQTGATAHYQKWPICRETGMSGRELLASTAHTGQEVKEERRRTGFVGRLRCPFVKAVNGPEYRKHANQ